MNKKSLKLIIFVFGFLQGGLGLAQVPLIEKVQTGMRQFASCKANVLGDPELARDLYQSDRTSAAKAETYLRDFAVSNFGPVDAAKLERDAYNRAAFEVYHPNKTYNQLSLTERRGRLTYCRSIFEHYAK